MLDQVHVPPGGGDGGAFHAPATARHAPQFTGRAGEYFGIWFVNLILSILTLGIYSAWAKVRTERYFYGHTRLAGSAFDYLASPMAILRGRLVAYAVVIALVVSSNFAPMLYLALFAAIALAMPAILVLGMRFRARYSAWRGLRFRFSEDPGDAYGPFMGWPIASMFSLGLLYPVMKQRQHLFVADGHLYGRRRFRFHGQSGAYYAPFLLAMLIVIGAFVAMTLAIGVAAALVQGEGDAGMWAVLGMVLPFYLGLFAVGVFLRVRYTNLFWNNTSIEGHRFESTLRVRDMLWIYGSNIVAIVCTLGLAVPWAMVRLARYRAAHFALLAEGDLEGFVAGAEQERSAAGAELVEALDTGIEIGI